MKFIYLSVLSIKIDKICVQQRVVTLTRFVYHNLYKLIQNVYIKFKKPQAGYNWCVYVRSKHWHKWTLTPVWTVL